MTETLAGHPLPENLYWQDEFDRWEPVAQARERGIDGTLHIQEAPYRGGRPITLRGAWVERTELEALRSMSEGTDPMTLVFEDGREYRVRWRRDGRRPAVEGEPVFPRANPGPEHLYILTIRLVEVTE
ncbi:MAG: hypothetical protein ACLFSR_03905 [Halomonas sp.]